MLTFYPLYWVYHDCWRYQETVQPEDGKDPQIATFDHAGHIHFFMMDYNPAEHATCQAYTGSQKYTFAIEDVWGPNSDDANQVRSYKLVGKPRWYFYIEEYWRRVYIQNWDVEDYSETYPNHPGRLGIRYDASKADHSLGPFREGGGLYFFDTEMNRTLPVEYWLDVDKAKRQHFLKQRHYNWDETSGGQTWDFGVSKWEWGRISKGWYWAGDNVTFTYDDDDWYYTRTGYNAPGDIVKVTTNGHETFYRNEFVPSSPVVNKGADYYPNPTPGASEAKLRQEYLAYFDFTIYWGEWWADRYNTAYTRWCARNGGDSQENFEIFLNSYPVEGDLDYYDEYYDNENEMGLTYLGIFKENCLASDHQTLNYEFIGFGDFCAIWHELTRSEAIAARVWGDYPLLREEATIPSARGDEFGDENTDPFNKDGEHINPYDIYLKYFEYREEYTIPRNTEADGNKVTKGPHPRESSFSDEDGARRFYADNLYIAPVIEYQKVIQRNYERLPEAETAEEGIDIWTDTSGNFGDGFEVSIEIPYRVSGVIQSPFSDDDGNVSPPGEYFHGFPDSQRMRYALESYGNPLDEDTCNDDGTLSKMMEKVKRFSLSAYSAWIKEHPEPTDTSAGDDEEEVEESDEHVVWVRQAVSWLNENYANRPILYNSEEGMFDENGVWIPPMTYDRPTKDQAEEDEDGNPTCTGKVVQFQNNGLRTDGIWVEQCLGAKVVPRVQLIFEDALGHRWEEWVDSSSVESTSATAFKGTD